MTDLFKRKESGKKIKGKQGN